MFRSGFAEGLVISKRMNKTVMVSIPRYQIHKKYKVRRPTQTVLMVHDELNECVPGDRVLIRQCRPYSKRKHWIIHDIIQPYKPAEYLRKHPEIAEKFEKSSQFK
jgi:small subunit ribosomal protein S17